LKPVQKAWEDYETGIEAGHLSALAQIYGDGIVNLNIGNIRPGETVTVYIEILAGVETSDKGFRFRFPFTLAPAYHRQAQAVVNEWGQLDQELPEIVEAESRYSAHANGSSRGAGKRMRNRVKS
jgi:hypothetical protein